jgi:hypothetical protein
MKKISFILTMLTLAFFAQAQSYEDIGLKIFSGKYADAKKDIDKRITNEKFASKPDAYILKTAIYAQLASTAEGEEAEQLLSQAQAAYKKYTEMDPALSLVDDPIYKNGFINLYSAMYSRGFAGYQAKNWEKAAGDFKTTVELSDLLIQKKVFSIPVDTNALIMAGFTAENSGHRDDAAKYYTRLADNKIGGKGNDFLYRFLIVYNYQKGNIDAFNKYKALGKELYPDDEYYDYDEVDFAVGLSETYDAKVKALEGVLAKDPTNYKANVNLAQLISDTLNTSASEGKPLANAAELEKRMIDAITKALEAKPDDATLLMFLGDHYIAKAEKVNEERAEHVKAMQARTKPGAKPSAADVAKRDELDKKYGEAMEVARDPYEKAANVLAKKADITPREKQQYRNIAGYLYDIYNLKKIQAKANPAEASKYEAAAKKWNELYDSIK